MLQELERVGFSWKRAKELEKNRVHWRINNNTDNDNDGDNDNDNDNENDNGNENDRGDGNGNGNDINNNIIYYNLRELHLIRLSLLYVTCL